MNRRSSVLLLVAYSVLFTFTSSRAVAGQFYQLVVFGDSLSDTGNVFAFNGGVFPPSSPPGVLYDQGRLSNGPVWVEYLAGAIGAAAPTPSLLGGTNFAWGGAQTKVSFEPYDSTLDPDPFPISTTVAIRDQVGSFLGGVAQAGVVPDADETLYVIWGGANDFSLGGERSANLSVKNIESDVMSLVDAVGARHILVANMPSLTDTPAVGGGFPSAFASSSQTANLDYVVRNFNKKLSHELDKVEQQNPGVQIYQFDVFGLYQDVLRDPAAYGFNPLTQVPALNEAVLYGTEVGPLFLNDPATTLFWDGVHPTTRAHQVLAQEAAALVMGASNRAVLIPEPSASALLLLALFPLSQWRRRALLRSR